MLITYEEYVSYGGTADEAAFSRLEFLAEKSINRYTQGRVGAMETPPEAVKRCAAELVSILDRADVTALASSGTLSGFANDGYSESYTDPLTVEKLDQNTYAIIRAYLSGETDDKGTPLLWLGVDKP